MINVGARSTNLTFISPAGLFIRNINLGGNSLTQSLADGMGKSFNIVEDLKVSFYSGTTTFEAEDPAVAALQARGQDFMKRLSQQVTQSIIAYRRATNRAAPQRILLTGRGSLLDGLPEFLSESQKVSVDYFNPGTVVKSGSRLGKGVMEQYYYQISECVGEAARLAKPDAMGINLLPHTIRARMQFNKQKPFLVLSALCLALAPLPMIYKFYVQKNVDVIEKKSWDTRATDLTNLYQNLQKQSDEATATRKQIADLESLMNSRFNWIQFFQKLQDALVDIKDVWLDSLSVEREVITAPPAAGFSSAKAAAAAATEVPAAPATSYKLKVKGRLLLRLDNPDAPVSETVRNKAADRLTDLQNRLLGIPFIKGIDQSNKIIDFRTDPRMAGFDFTLIINPENPL